MKKLYIFRGLPGSGKSTWAREMAALVVEPDQFRYDADMNYVFDSDKNAEVFEKTNDLLEYAVRHLKVPAVAIAATHVRLDHVRRYVDLGQKYGYAVCIVECYGSYGNVHNVPDSVVAKMAREFEPLTDFEAKHWNVSVVRHYHTGTPDDAR